MSLAALRLEVLKHTAVVSVRAGCVVQALSRTVGARGHHQQQHALCERLQCVESSRWA